MQLIVWLICFSIISSIFCDETKQDLHNELKSKDKMSESLSSESHESDSGSEDFDSDSVSVEIVGKDDSDAEEYEENNSKEQNVEEIEFKIDPRSCFGSSNSSRLSCESQCGECMKFCNAKNLKKVSSNCRNGKICCVLTRRQKS